MQRVLQCVAALAILVLVGATVATADAAPAKSFAGFVTSHANGHGNGGGHGNGNGNGGGSGNGNGQSHDGGNGNQGNQNQDKHSKKNKKNKSSKSDDGKNKSKDDKSKHKVMICHQTGSDSNPAVVIVVDEHAVAAHEKHGDKVIQSADECEGAKGTAS